MNAFQRFPTWSKQAAREHWLPLAILVVPINWVVWQSDADNVYPFLILPLVAFVVGFSLRPRHVWLVWLGSVVVTWIVVGVWGKYGEAGSDETVASIMVEAFGWMFLGVLIPVWLGRFVHAAVDKSRHPDQTLGTGSGGSIQF